MWDILSTTGRRLLLPEEQQTLQPEEEKVAFIGCPANSQVPNSMMNAPVTSYK